MVIKVYRQRILKDVCVAGFLTLIAGSVTWRFFQNVPHIILAFCIAMVGAWWHLPFEWRRAVIFGDDLISYRFNTGRTLSISVNEIRQVDNDSMTYMMGFRPIPVPAIKLTLKDGTVHRLPIDFPDRDEIFARLRSVVNSSAAPQRP